MTLNNLITRSELKHHVFLNMAIELSKLSTCLRLKVGCILLNSNGGIASGGYNGALSGMPHCNQYTCNQTKRCLHTSHAEENALNFCNQSITVAYVTHEPCLACTRSLARRDVQKVIFLNLYKSIDDNERNERTLIINHFNIEWLYKPLSKTNI